MRVKFILLGLFLLNFALGQNLEKVGITKMALDNFESEIGTPICGTIFLNDEVGKRALENTRIYNPELYSLMIKSTIEKTTPVKSADTIGTRRNFYVYNLTTGQFDYIVAELRAIGNLTQVWVDTTELSNGHVSQVEVDAILNALENQTPSASRDPNKGIVSLDHQYFGNPPNKDGDGKTDFLITDIKDGWQPGGSYVAGFFFSWDQTDTAGSNRRDMLYIVSYPGIYYNNTRDPQRPLSTLAHEYQHLIHYNYDRDEATFVNEGLSEVAEVICGYPLRVPLRYFNNTDVPLFDWNNISGNVLADYERAALFTLYYTEQLGDDVLKQIVQEPANGTTGYDNVFSRKGKNFIQILTNWFVANYLKDKNVDPAYGYLYPVPGTPKEANYHNDPNVNVTNQSIWGYAVDYIVFAFGESLKVTFTTSSSLVKIKAIKLGSSIKQVVDVPIGTQFQVPEFGTTVSTVVFVVMNTGPTNATYSYTSQGRQVAFYVETAYDDGTPDRFAGQANFLGFGNNSVDYGWAVKFIPEVRTNQLLYAKILAAFAQEFSGSTVPANAPKDFYFHVWSDNGGLPGNDIITFLFSTNRPGYDGQFLTIDLTPYASQLTNLGTIYIGFTENDTIGTYVGMDSTTKTNYTYAFFGPTHPNNPNQWIPMENLQVQSGGTLIPLRGWNMMMRAVFAYMDTTKPQLIVGFFQNPIFSEQLDVFVASPSKLNKNNLSGTLTQGSNVKTLNFQPVPNSNEKVFVDNNVTLTSSGTIEIRVRSTTKYGFIYSDTAYTFNVQFLQSVSGGYITSTDGKMEAEFGRNSLKDNIYVIAFAGNSDVLNDEIENSIRTKLSQIYTLSPVGYELNKPAILKIYLDPAKISSIPPEELVIAYWDGTKWVGLNSTVSNSGQLISAEINKLGHFIVTRKSEVTSVETTRSVEIPDKFELYQNYPNPFNPSTSITFDLPKDEFVTLKIYNVIGQEVRTLVNEFRNAGRYTVVWDGKDNFGKVVPSGIYFYRMTAGSFNKTMKMVLAK
ncbi:FlgD immunoglobulin-like domain containing protein [Candidatus Chrysopegis kryptomonas]|uniref:Por secretion system C-terminal sorting domain-containing protein n=1 Tax=Candidatus Chryseopegocella kryptomonas TaxID=1633643 RepID=A0A0P1MMR8_9BACT|nr:FlgD immunoglobulin-like domain containing protein [Candidatus Chrysopegis kryptomonas]CUS96985.1 Por secretion system C-terminal sorting domain-containing protein [Candidatus Chrysopegis kryptomonas]